MKLRYLIFALLTFLTTTKIAAQTVTTATVSSAVKTASVVGNDLKHKKYHKAAGTVLKHKMVSDRFKLDKKVQDKILDPNFNLKKAKADVRKNPVAFAEKAEKEMRGMDRPKWLKGNKKVTPKKATPIKKK